jgi:hypothetical protein
VACHGRPWKQTNKQLPPCGYSIAVNKYIIYHISYQQQKQQQHIAENTVSKASHLQVVSEDSGHFLREKHDKLVLSQERLFEGKSCLNSQGI